MSFNNTIKLNAAVRKLKYQSIEANESGSNQFTTITQIFKQVVTDRSKANQFS